MSEEISALDRARGVVYRARQGSLVVLSAHECTARKVVFGVDGRTGDHDWFVGHAEPFWPWQLSIEAAIRKAIERAEHFDYRAAQRQALLDRAKVAVGAEAEVRRIMAELP